MNDRQARQQALSEWLLELRVLWAVFPFKRRNQSYRTYQCYSVAKGRIEMNGYLVSALTGLAGLIIGLIIIRLTPEDRPKRQ